MKSLGFKLFVWLLETVYMVIGGGAVLFVFLALNSGTMGLPASPWLGIFGALVTMIAFIVPIYFLLRSGQKKESFSNK